MPNQSTPDIPAEARAAASAAREALQNVMELAKHRLPSPIDETFDPVCAVSRLVSEYCRRNPVQFATLATSGALSNPRSATDYASALKGGLESIDSDDNLKRALRQCRNAEMVRIAYRDIAGWADLEETLENLSDLAEACIRASLDWLFARACHARATPLNRAGQPQNLVVLGMGKLGAKELNFSSDIDLIFAYEDDGTLDDRRETSYREFYTRLAQSLVAVLDDITADGFVFRVDTRLRPFGDSGPLVMSFDAMEAYYQSQAREWERYAMVKARPVAGDPEACANLEKLLKPFIYRRYLDYRAFGELRELKRKITAELLKKDRLDNVKLGPGGIREIEFIGQAFQLIRGGREKRLQQRGILTVLEALAELNQLPAEVVAELRQAYRYLRRAENRIQQYADQQTHDLPKDPQARVALALGMGHGSWETFAVELDLIRAGVHRIFQQVIEAPETAAAIPTLWLDLDDDGVATALASLGFSETTPVTMPLLQFLRGNAVKRLTPRGAQELNRLLPPLLTEVLGLANPAVTLERVIRLLEAVTTRTVYLTLLAENATVRSQLVRLADASSWIAQYIASHPLLLDELIDPRQLQTPLSLDQLNAQLARRMASVEDDDGEQLMTALRQFKQANVLRIAAADLMGIIPIMVVSDYLTWLAESLVTEVLAHAWHATVARHGVPDGIERDGPHGFAVIAYGKMGGLELSYASDLDLVFLYGGVADDAMTDGPQPLSATQFFGRIAKRMINVITTRLLSGALYELDLRLRPSGNSGLLVSSLDAYRRYQMESAWTWEQQALVRARFVAGDPAIGERFGAIRREALGRERELAALRTDVAEMRQKMRDNLACKDPGRFDLKQGEGGIADIEFIVQFGTLACSHRHPQLLRWTDVVRLLETLATIGFLAGDEAASLKRAYCLFREQAHRAALLDAPALIAATELEPERAAVRAAWHRIMD
ncbi:MAG: bifunctional [glutamate--ammonia ligase]-adenylyl-L-tyrosine phosphorylase/[glutamate--ammonia-ligase] adenylyltransferase [Methylococcaceae bacterium]|nr:bifunctional [glutamate--ammonia ligase]-adenylyl-L-tyrosine phosphorylase/[glutamate--ammonia-ligase] adenylyltransferase [Methylococcaceae bacterium]